MSSGLPTKADFTEEIPKMSDGVTRALETFQGVENRILRRFLLLLPWFILLIVVVNLQNYGFTDIPAKVVMWTTGMVAAALSLFALHSLMKRIPETLGILWDRRIVSDMLETQYLNFIDDLQKLMNHRGQWAMGLFFSLLVFTWWLRRDIYIQQLIIELFIAIIIRLMAWRMVIAAIEVWQLGKKFYLEPQLGHADKCGGLAPLGNLCFWNILIITIPAIYLGGWIILGTILEPDNLYDQYYKQARNYAPLFSKLLLILVPFAVAGFFLPLWSVHKVMVTWGTEVKRQLNQLSHQIDHLECEILDKSDMLESQEVAIMAKKLELMQQIQQQNRHIPAWPFNIKILVKFTTSQVVPALGFISSLLFEKPQS